MLLSVRPPAGNFRSEGSSYRHRMRLPRVPGSVGWWRALSGIFQVPGATPTTVPFKNPPVFDLPEATTSPVHKDVADQA